MIGHPFFVQLQGAACGFHRCTGPKLQGHILQSGNISGVFE